MRLCVVRPLPLALLAVAAALAACSEMTSPGVDPASFVPLQRIALAFDPASRPPHGRKLRWPEQDDARARGDGERLQLGDGAELTIALPGLGDLRAFESLAFRVSGPGTAASEIGVVLRTGGELVECTTARAEIAGGTSVVRAALPGSIESAGAIEITLRGELAGVELDAPVLEWRAPAKSAELLAASEVGEFDLLLGGERRVARCLRPGEVARGALLPNAAGARLSFAYGALDERLGNPGRAFVRVTIASPAGELQTSEFALDKPGAWLPASVELAPSTTPRQIALELVLEKQGWLALAFDAPSVVTPRDDAPCVLLVTSDTHRGDHVGAARSGVAIETRAIDALAERGLFFSDCFATTNVTLPSHVALLTGAHPRDSGIADNNTELAEDAPALAEVFRAAGWRTFAVTSVNLLSADFGGVGQGFDRMSWPAKRRGAAETIELARAWLADARGEPLFAWVHVFDAHSPYEPPRELERKYYDAAKDPFDAAHEPADWRRPAWREDVRDPEFVRALYRGEIDQLDAALASLLDEPRVRDGVVALTGDHGEVLGSHGIWWEHKSLYPDTLHVPLVLCAPGVERGVRVDAPVQNSDLGRTLLDLARLAGREFPGRNLLNALDGERFAGAPRFALAGQRQSASITHDGAHLLLHLEELAEGRRTGRAKHQVELFDLRADPRCERDLVDVEPERASALRGELVAWLAAASSSGWAGEVHKDGATLRNLAALGYAAGEGPSPELLLDPQCPCSWCARWR